MQRVVYPQKLTICAVLLVMNSTILADLSCNNPVKQPYNQAPKFKAPDGTRGHGIRIWIDGRLSDIPDTSAPCLPIALRYNNLGALKTPSKSDWPEQIGKDTKGHAIFPSVEAGVAAWGIWIKRRTQTRGEQSVLSIMSVYAPPSDCVGSVGTPPDCPYGLNPTAEYAARVAASVGKGPDDPLNLDGADCEDGRDVLYALFQQLSTFEIGANFCGKESRDSVALCITDRALFDRAMDKAYGPLNHVDCSKSSR